MQGETGVGPVDTLVVWSVAVVAVAGLLGILWRAVRTVRRLVLSLEQFLDDWRGTPDRPGVPGTPGVMARIGRIEDELRTAVDLTEHRRTEGDKKP